MPEGAADGPADGPAARASAAGGGWTGMDRQLWPGGAATERPGPGTTPYLCLPSRSDVRLVVPLANRRAATQALQRRLAGGSWSAGVRRVLATVATRTGAARGLSRRVLHVDGDGELAAVLGGWLGREVVLAVHLGAARANRKPVLEVMDTSGRVLAWGKLGVNPLTQRLVRDEGLALERLGQLAFRFLQAPVALLRTQWHGNPLLLTSPLSPSVRPVPPELLVRASYELAEAIPSDDQGGDWSEYHGGLSARVHALPPTPLRAGMTDVLPGLARAVPSADLGAWHGDWTPWNMGVCGSTLCVWDWERFASPVPVGFDLLHHRFQTQAARRSHAPSAALALLDWAPPTRAGRTPPPPRQRQALAVLYLVDLGARYLADDQAAAGNRLGRVSEWLGPALAAWTDRPARSTLPPEEIA